MKIAILTQALYNNYGGILQNYALQTVLKRMGHEVETLDWDAYEFFFKDNNDSLYKDVKVLINRLIRRRYNKTSWEKRRCVFSEAKNNQCFIDKYIRRSKYLYTVDDYKDYAQKMKFDAYVVGSDQVWRPRCNQHGMQDRMFLDFVPDNTALKISYAASFGIDDNEFTNLQIQKYSKLIRKFDNVSVREESAIALCKELFSFDNIQLVLDPTLLLRKEDYINLIVADNNIMFDGNFYSYILDNSVEIKNCIKKIEYKYGLKSFSVSDINSIYYDSHYKNSTPSLVCWLAAFQNADYIICDSFHGTVFSLIFNKQFVVLANKERGLARMESLLKMFDLSDRLLLEYDHDLIGEKLTKKINWNYINKTIELHKIKSISFLSKALIPKYDKQ